MYKYPTRRRFVKQFPTADSFKELQPEKKCRFAAVTEKIERVLYEFSRA